MDSATGSRRPATRVSLRLAKTEDDFDGAFRLVHDAYCRAGLHEPSPSGLRVTPHQLLETSQVFVACLDDDVICTLTLVRDNDAGLPIEAAYPELLAQRRAAGREVAEVTCLADRRLSPKRFFSLFCDLSRYMVQFARREGVDEIWVACHPNHAALYERRLAFGRRGGLAEHPAVRGNPALPLCVDLCRLKDDHPAVWERFFAEPLPGERLRPTAIPSSEIAFYRSVARSDEAPADPAATLAVANGAGG